MRFAHPVRVATGKAGNVAIVVADAERAARLLLAGDWPGDGAASRQVAARKAVLAALERAQDPVRAEQARMAFAEAAAEAGVLLPERPRPVGQEGPKAARWRKRSSHG